MQPLLEHSQNDRRAITAPEKMHNYATLTEPQARHDSTTEQLNRAQRRCMRVVSRERSKAGGRREAGTMVGREANEEGWLKGRH